MQSPPLENYRLEDQIGFLIRKASQRHAHIFSQRMVEQLTPTQWAALVKLAEAKPVSQNQLGRDTAMDAATIKGVVDRLIRRGLATTRPDPEDSRRSLIAITPKGQDVVMAGLPAAQAITGETLSALGAGEQETLRNLLRKLA